MLCIVCRRYLVNICNMWLALMIREEKMYEFQLLPVSNESETNNAVLEFETYNNYSSQFTRKLNFLAIHENLIGTIYFLFVLFSTLQAHQCENYGFFSLYRRVCLAVWRLSEWCLTFVEQSSELAAHAQTAIPCIWENILSLAKPRHSR